jgi:hypothetical protein
VPPPKVAAVQVNDGSAQRSEVRSLSVTFSAQVTIAGNPFTLTRVGGWPVGLMMGTPSLDGQGRTVVPLTFVGTDEIDPASVLNGGSASLADGRYQMSIADGAVTGAGGALDGDGNGTAGGVYQSPTDTAAGGPGQLRLFRLFGDATGDGFVDALDIGVLRATFNASVGDPGYLAYLDGNNDGHVDALDLQLFRPRFNTNLFGL